jgi:hypothetical protein
VSELNNGFEIEYADKTFSNTLPTTPENEPMLYTEPFNEYVYAVDNISELT